MTTIAPQNIPTHNIYLGDKLAQLAGPDFDVEMDQLLTDESLPIEQRVEIAGQRDELITEISRRIAELRAHIDRRHRRHAQRADHADAMRRLREQRNEERAAAEKAQAAERLVLDTARQRAKELAVTLEPCRIPYEGAARRSGLGTIANLSEQVAWRVTAPHGHPLVQSIPEETRDYLVRTLDKTGVELMRGTLRSCCQLIAREHATAQASRPETPADPVTDAGSRGIFRRR